MARDSIDHPASFNPAAIVDLQRYPIDDISSGVGRDFADHCRAEYQASGLCSLADFILPEARNRLAAEAETLRANAYFCKSTHNAYLNDGDPNSAECSVANRQLETFVGSVAYDHIPQHAALRRLYLWDPLKDFIGYVLQKAPFYRFADPFGACSINVFVDGGEHGWHFDESEYTVTLMLQKPEYGGAFEYVPQVRGLVDEKTIVESVLNGNREHVIELPFTAGTLLIFGGRQTLHRVSRVSGDKARLVPVLCYAEEPNLTNSSAVRELFWGRSGL